MALGVGKCICYNKIHLHGHTLELDQTAFMETKSIATGIAIYTCIYVVLSPSIHCGIKKNSILGMDPEFNADICQVH